MPVLVSDWKPLNHHPSNGYSILYLHIYIVLTCNLKISKWDFTFIIILLVFATSTEANQLV